ATATGMVVSPKKNSLLGGGCKRDNDGRCLEKITCVQDNLPECPCQLPLSLFGHSGTPPEWSEPGVSDAGRIVDPSRKCRSLTLPARLGSSLQFRQPQPDD